MSDNTLSIKYFFVNINLMLFCEIFINYLLTLLNR